MLDALLDELAPESEEMASSTKLPSVAPLSLRSSAVRSIIALTRENAGKGLPLVQALRAGAPAKDLALAGAQLQDADLRGLDLRGANFTGANLARANLAGASLFGAQLNDAMLYGATFDDAELTGADLSGANLETAHGKNTGFGAATFKGTRLAEACFAQCALGGAHFIDADLRAAAFPNARAVGVELLRCDLTSASLAGANLRDARVAHSHFDHANLRGATLTGVRDYESASWIGTDTRDIPPLGIFMWKRFVTDQNYLAEFRTRGRASELAYWLWWATSDCGRSMWRWTLCTMTIILAFAGAFTFVPVSYGDHPTWLSSVYFSVITITSLGYGDVLPASAGAQALAMTEVVIGYLMLGGLLSILSNKMARRGD